MLTRIEINGFKAFRNFALDFRPFQVFIGANGVGKTNLFDAIALLSHLAGDHSLTEAFSAARGEIVEIFSLNNDGSRAEKMEIAVEFLLDRSSTDANGKKFTPTNTRFRYEIAFERRGEGAHIVSENLIGLPESKDGWVKEHIPTKARKTWAVREKRPPYITTVTEANQTTLYRNQDTLAGGREGVKADNLQRSVLSSSDPVRYPTIHAVREAMKRWQFLQLLPTALRNPAKTAEGSLLLPDGANLAAALHRLSQDHAAALTKITAEMRNLIPSVRQVMTKTLEARGETLLEIESEDGTRFSSRVLSDGTLRLLAMVCLRHDPLHRGVICFEEPENGVQPIRLKQMMAVLFGLASSFEEEPAEGDPPPLRQVLINTHSPHVIAEVPRDSLYFMGMKSEAGGRHTYTVPVRPELFEDEGGAYLTWKQVENYLDTTALAKKRDELGL